MSLHLYSFHFGWVLQVKQVKRAQIKIATKINLKQRFMQLLNTFLVWNVNFNANVHQTLDYSALYCW